MKWNEELCCLTKDIQVHALVYSLNDEGIGRTPSDPDKSFARHLKWKILLLSGFNYLYHGISIMWTLVTRWPPHIYSSGFLLYLGTFIGQLVRATDKTGSQIRSSSKWRLTRFQHNSLEWRQSRLATAKPYEAALFSSFMWSSSCLVLNLIPRQTQPYI